MWSEAGQEHPQSSFTPLGVRLKCPLVSSQLISQCFWWCHRCPLSDTAERYQATDITEPVAYIAGVKPGWGYYWSTTKRTKIALARMISVQCQSVLSSEELTFLELCLSYVCDIRIILIMVDVSPRVISNFFWKDNIHKDQNPLAENAFETWSKGQKLDSLMEDRTLGNSLLRCNSELRTAGTHVPAGTFVSLRSHDNSQEAEDRSV